MQTFNLDISDKKIVPLLQVKQKDIGTKIAVTITDNGRAYTIPSGASFSVWFSGKSGDGNYTKIGNKSAFSIQGSTVTVELILQMLNNPGEHLMCLVMNDATGNQIGLWNIPYYVEELPGANSEPATKYFENLEAAQEAADRAEAAAKRAEAAGGGGGSVVPLIVTVLEDGTASEDPWSMRAHISNGGDVYLQRYDIQDSNELIQFSYFDQSGCAVFNTVDKEGYVYAYVIDSYRSIEVFEHKITGGGSSASGKDGKDGFSIYQYNGTFATDTTMPTNPDGFVEEPGANVPPALAYFVADIIVPDGRTVQVGDFLLDTNGVLVIVTDTDGSSFFYSYVTTLKGTDGEDGDDGYTPVKGTDYWTEADKAEMVADVIAALPVYNGELVDTE